MFPVISDLETGLETDSVWPSSVPTFLCTIIFILHVRIYNKDYIWKRGIEGCIFASSKENGARRWTIDTMKNTLQSTHLLIH